MPASTAAFVLQRMGHEVLSLPTALAVEPAGIQSDCGRAHRCREARRDAARRGATAGLPDAILTGYIPTAAHAALCEKWIKALRHDALYVCDPIVGDEPAGVYIHEEAALAIREKLMPLAKAR